MAVRRWKTVRVPLDLAERLERLARSLEDAHSTGRAPLPPHLVEGVPLHHVIARAVDDLEGHRERARAPRAKPPRLR